MRTRKARRAKTEKEKREGRTPFLYQIISGAAAGRLALIPGMAQIKPEMPKNTAREQARRIRQSNRSKA